MIVAASDTRFAVQRISDDEWVRAVAANAAADALAGHGAVVRAFLDSREEPRLRAALHDIAASTPAQLADLVAQSRCESLVMLVLMLTGACNADCRICFTDRRAKAGEISGEDRDRVLREARALGARFVYVPGEGEPTMDGGFWGFLETCRSLGLEAIVFTNGIAFSDPLTCQRYLGLDVEEAVSRLAEYPVSFYHKLWSFDPALTEEMMQIRSQQYRYADLNGRTVPVGLLRLLERLPAGRVGIEVVAERRNADEVVDAILPFAGSLRLPRIVELVQHNGRTLGDGSFDPSPAQVQRLVPHLSPTSCALAPCKAVVTSTGLLSPRIAVLEHQIPAPAANVRSAPLFELLHGTEYLVRYRYQIHACLCETIPQGCAARQSTVTTPIFNVAAGQLAGRCRTSS